MSQEDVDLVLAFYATYNARELDAAVDLCAVDLNAFPDASVFPESGSLVGRDELQGFLEETWTAWASGGVTPKEVLDIGDGRVLVRADWGATGSASGVEIHTSLTAIVTIRDGLISRIEWFFDHDQALKAVGLEE
jgi:ketosteroid isomerase-like protein